MWRKTNVQINTAEMAIIIPALNEMNNKNRIFSFQPEEYSNNKVLANYLFTIQIFVFFFALAFLHRSVFFDKQNEERRMKNLNISFNEYGSMPCKQ